MRHEGTLSLPADTKHIVVDPLVDFARTTESRPGAFIDCYGREDVQPVIDAIVELQTMVLAWHEQVYCVLCKSQYQYDQFGVPGLEELCTTPERRTSLIPEEWFRSVFTKYDNSILSAQQSVSELLGDGEYVGIEGITLTSCVTKSIQDIRTQLRGKKIVVPINAVGWRAKQEQVAQEIISELSNAKVRDVVVVDRWQQIEHQ